MRRVFAHHNMAQQWRLRLTSHFTARREPAIVALPTGVGKTAVMTLLPYLLAARRVLVIVPTRVPSRLAASSKRSRYYGHKASYQMRFGLLGRLQSESNLLLKIGHGLLRRTLW